MTLYPPRIRRCHHIRVNGIQCGSPAMRGQTYCYYHSRCHNTDEWAALRQHDGSTFPGLPTLEDANSIQVGLAEVMRLLVTQEIDHRTGALLLYAMQTASANLRWISLEPKQPTQVVIDRESVAHCPIGATAWSKEEGREYDEIAGDESKEEKLVDGMTAADREYLE
jgi:hypothetical protein